MRQLSSQNKWKNEGGQEVEKMVLDAEAISLSLYHSPSLSTQAHLQGNICYLEFQNFITFLF